MWRCIPCARLHLRVRDLPTTFTRSPPPSRRSPLHAKWPRASRPPSLTSRGHWVPHGDLSDWRTVWFAYVRFPASHTGFRGGLPRRWVVERTIAWIGRNRRMSKDDEDPLATSEAGGSLSMVRVMLIKRLAREQVEPEFHSRRAA